jgi:acetyltransferase
VLLEHEAKSLLKLSGAPVTTDVLATTALEAVEAAKFFKGPAALKLSSPDILHKSDAGGVRLNLEGDDAIGEAYGAILANAERAQPNADIRGVVVSPMAREGVEVIIGTKIDALFGPVIMFGLGGIFVEMLKDVSFRVLPITHSLAKEMIAEIRSAGILDGVRGRPARDKRALAKLLVTCSDLIESYPDIEEMDLNPVIVHDNGLSIVDARIILKNSRPAKRAAVC